MKSNVFITAIILCSSLSINATKANPFNPLHTQSTPISGVTTFDDLYSGTTVDLTGLKSAGGGGLNALNVSGYDLKLYASSSSPECGISIEPINGQSALVYAYTQNPAINLSSLQISSNDKSYFDLSSIDITIDSFSAGTSQTVRLMGYRNGVLVSGAFSSKTVTAASSGGLLVNFNVSALSGFKNITSVSIQSDGTYQMKGGIGVDNINATNFRTVLPVNLISYNAILLQDKTVSLNWQTTNEINNSYFIINKSGNGINFSPLGKVESNSPGGSVVNYNFIDAHPLNGNNFYRLTQVDIDGNQKILSIKKVSAKITGLPSLYPNPVLGNSVTLNYGKILPSKVLYKLVDASGKIVSSGKIFQQSQEINLPVLSAGIYTIQLSDGKSIMFEKK